MSNKKISQLTAATTPLAGTEVLPIVQSGSTVKVTNNDLRPKQIQSNATSGVLQIAGPSAATTRTMTTPDADFTVAQTNAAQNFTGNNTFDTSTLTIDSTNHYVGVGTTASKSQLSVYKATTGGEVRIYSNTDTAYGSLIFSSNNNTYLGYGASIESYGASGGIDSGALVFKVSDGGQPRFEAARISPNSNMTLTYGNLIIGTSGKGIDFSATPQPAGMTSELLNDYEEGTWTPAITYSVSNGDLSYALQSGFYTKIGRCVTFEVILTFGETTASGYITQISGLPYTSAASTAAGGGAYVDNMSGLVGAGTWVLGASSTALNLYFSGTGSVGVISNSNTGAASNVIRIAGFYYAT